ncbi:hypothetical protein B0H16DRAFT_270919 [Mycena metata]|uniref:Uncharacterized protein n=1 Tax=Mycena metata TaxID=1033252 RepID=A0AAD7MPF5_9AGAR|nr:hypothetical protein B0H16DRAFT_270919 [Mycena metata]
MSVCQGFALGGRFPWRARLAFLGGRVSSLSFSAFLETRSAGCAGRRGGCGRRERADADWCEKGVRPEGRGVHYMSSGSAAIPCVHLQGLICRCPLSATLRCLHIVLARLGAGGAYRPDSGLGRAAGGGRPSRILSLELCCPLPLRFCSYLRIQPLGRLCPACSRSAMRDAAHSSSFPLTGAHPYRARAAPARRPLRDAHVRLVSLGQ